MIVRSLCAFLFRIAPFLYKTPFKSIAMSQQRKDIRNFLACLLAEWKNNKHALIHIESVAVHTPTDLKFRTIAISPRVVGQLAALKWNIFASPNLGAGLPFDFL